MPEVTSQAQLLVKTEDVSFSSQFCNRMKAKVDVLVELVLVGFKTNQLRTRSVVFGAQMS